MSPAAVPRSLVDRIAAVVGESHCVTEPEQLRTYECDGLTSFRARPGLVVLPGSTEEVSRVVRLGEGLKAKVADRDEISIVPAVAGG